MVKLKEIIKKLSPEELKELEKELRTDSIHVKHIIEKEIKQNKVMKEKVCIVCGNPISQSKEPLTLFFGRRDFRKKAYFCAVDCLEFYLKQTKNPETTPKPKKTITKKRQLGILTKIIYSISKAFEY